MKSDDDTSQSDEVEEINADDPISYCGFIPTDSEDNSDNHDLKGTKRDVAKDTDDTKENISMELGDDNSQCDEAEVINADDPISYGGFIPTYSEDNGDNHDLKDINRDVAKDTDDTKENISMKSDDDTSQCDEVEEINADDPISYCGFIPTDSEDNSDNHDLKGTKRDVAKDTDDTKENISMELGDDNSQCDEAEVINADDPISYGGFIPTYSEDNGDNHDLKDINRDVAKDKYDTKENISMKSDDDTSQCDEAEVINADDPISYGGFIPTDSEDNDDNHDLKDIKEM
ncbi:unnamed protein product [Mytilus edulis]|uniref:Uncharacterized protein n=1 Tax=Mytilus edulis TaxID=6550 RepID=A0A8S3QI75_MYTED|nr:unnamed protein product [Mytilus edulis]